MATSWEISSQIKEFYKRKLLLALDECDTNGSKTIVWDDELTGPIGLLCEYRFLQEKNVQRMYTLSTPGTPASDTKNIIFLVKPCLEHASKIDAIVQRCERAPTNSVEQQDFHVLFIPTCSQPCIKRLKELGAYGSLKTVKALPLYLYSLDADVVSMETPNILSDWLLYDVHSFTHDVASSIMDIQTIFGVIQHIYYKGDCSKKVCDMMNRMRKENAAEEEQITPRIDALIMIDRTTDPLSPLMSQLTYEGLIDELLGIQNTSISVPADRFPAPANVPQEAQTATTRKIQLISTDQLFSEIRDKNFNAVGSYLSGKAKAITAKFDEKNQINTIAEIKQFVSKLPNMQAERTSLATHTTIAEMLKNFTADEEFLEGLRCQQENLNGWNTDKLSTYIADCMCREEPLEKILRLISIQSFCNNGLKSSVLNQYKTDIIEIYGFGCMVLIANLEKAGFIRAQSQTSRNFTQIRDKLNLMVEGVNEKNPQDIAYVHSGYAPLSVRLIQSALKPGGWKSLSKILELLPGKDKHEVQKLPEGVRKRRGSITSSGSAGNTSTNAESTERTVLVWFMGGITYAEISALRFVCTEEQGLQIIVATTHMINGNSLIKQFGPQMEPVAVT